MSKIDEAIERVEQLGEDVSWSFGKITNDEHSLFPPGPGFGVAITDGKITVYEKSMDIAAATDRAIERYLAHKAAMEGKANG